MRIKPRLLFDDEFDSLSTRALNENTGTWDTQLWWGPDTFINNEEQYYVDTADDGTSKSGGNNPFSIQGGVLSITAEPASSGTSDGQQFTSGVLTTEHSFARTYGYFEISAQMPSGAGTAPAFWLLASSHQWPPELDVVEEIGQQPTKIVGTVHSAQAEQPGDPHQFFLNTPDVTAGFHTYGVDWQPDKITWYFDGIPYGSCTTPSDMHSPMFMVVNLAVGGNWPGSPPNPSQIDAAFKIDYIHVWNKFPGEVLAGPGKPKPLLRGTAATEPNTIPLTSNLQATNGRPTPAVSSAEERSLAADWTATTTDANEPLPPRDGLAFVRNLMAGISIKDDLRVGVDGVRLECGGFSNPWDPMSIEKNQPLWAGTACDRIAGTSTIDPMGLSKLFG